MSASFTWVLLLANHAGDFFQILEQPPSDTLHGLRIHSWVLVLEGRREVAEPFFIEPLTGLAHSVNSTNYHGIESVWNHRNYWANMQDCSEGVTVCSGGAMYNI